jgi:hypothetical protein
MGIELTREVVAALDSHLGVDALTRIMEERFAAQGDSATFAAAASLVRDGVIARVEQETAPAGPRGASGTADPRGLVNVANAVTPA